MLCKNKDSYFLFILLFIDYTKPKTLFFRALIAVILYNYFYCLIINKLQIYITLLLLLIMSI